MRLSTPIGLLLLGCTLVVPVLAFEQTWQADPPLDQQYPGPNGMAKFRKIVSGDFNGNLRRDAVFMDLNTVVYLSSPALFDSRVTMADPVNDIAVLSGAVPGKDLLVTVGPSGLKICERISPSTWNTITLADPYTDLIGAAFVATGDMNGDGWRDIVAVPANKRDLQLVYGGPNLAFTRGPTLVCPNQVINQLTTMNWTNANDTANTDEIVVVSNLGWGAVKPNGTWVKVVSNTVTQLWCAVMHPPTGTDRLIVRSVFGGTDRISINDETRTEGPYNLGALGIVAMATADMTPAVETPVDIDLVLTTNTDKDLRIYENLGGTQTFDWANPTKFKFGPNNRNPSLNATGPDGFTLGDFDNDGRNDAFAPAQGDVNPYPLGCWSSIALIRPNTNWTKYLCPITAAKFIESLDPGVLPDKIELTFAGPLYAPLQAGSGQTAEILVNLYHCPGLGQHTQLTPMAVGHITPIPPTRLNTTTWEFELPLGFSVDNSTDFFGLVAYQRVAASNGASVAISVPLVGWLLPSSLMHVADHAPEVRAIVQLHRKDDDAVLPSSWDEGPTVPPVPDEDEPVEVTGGG